MNGLSIKQLSRVTKIPNVGNPEQRYALIYTLMDKCEIMDKTNLLHELGLLCGEVNDIRIIRIHKDMNFESALAIAGAAGMKYEYLQSYFEGDLTPYQALRESDLL